MRSCPKTTVNHSTVTWHLKQIKKAKKLDKWVPCEPTTNQKNHHFKASFSLILWNNHKLFLDCGLNCDMGWKVGFILQPAVTSSVVGPRGSLKTLPRAKVESKKESWLLFGGLLPVWSTEAFWVPVKPLHSEKHAQQMRCTKNCSVHSWLWSTERTRFFSVTMPDCSWHNQHFKSWVNWATKFCFICHIHLTSHKQTITSSSILTTFWRENASTTRRTQKMLSKSSLNPEAWIFMLQE